MSNYKCTCPRYHISYNPCSSSKCTKDMEICISKDKKIPVMLLINDLISYGKIKKKFEDIKIIKQSNLNSYSSL